ncbi:MAG TPA: sulfotransferase [Rhodanobacteraceae bacterium]|jgi:tetratricopeptide (TPR) repeat protein|nr:sulfotransferase [Rhodanobacteraceae bacterium]
MTVSRLQGLSAEAAQQVIATAQAIENGGFELASARLAPLLAAYPNHPEVLRLHAGIRNMSGNYAEAIAAMKHAVAQRPQDPLYYNTLGAILGQAGDFDEAIESLRHACELQPDLAIAWFNLGVMLTRSMRHAEAVDALRRSVSLNPDYMPARVLLGDMLRMESRADEAAAEYRNIIALQPWTGMAWWGLADLKTLRFKPDDVEQIRQALRDHRARDTDVIAMGLALAKALDDEGRYAESMSALAQAHAVARRRQVWSAQAFSDGISSILAAFSPPPASSAATESGRGIIFITSMPRSGSTLVEQILASHSAVEGPGELPDLPMTLTEESHRRGQPFPNWVGDMHPEDWQRLGERYLQRTARWRERRPTSVDKLPANWYYIGAIRAMLPSAKIICCRRDPVETCFSCYRQHLDNNEYARTFHDLAAYWRDFDRSVRLWHTLHPAHVREHVYEDLVAAPDASIRALLDFCGLPFQSACLRFHENKRDVSTPSAMQVREPLRAGTARSARYGALLDPLRAALGLRPFAE